MTRALGRRDKTSISLVNAIMPTLSLLATALKPIRPAISVASSRLFLSTVPKSSDPLTSTATATFSSRSSTYFLTYGSPSRAVTFQSMLRTSSPGKYSRTSENSIPLPRNTARYSPRKRSLTSLREWISIRRIRFRSSGVSGPRVDSLEIAAMVEPAESGRRGRNAQGTSTLSSKRSMTWSGVTSSASAS